MNLLNEFSNLLSVLFPFIFIEVFLILLMLIKSDDIVFCDLNVDDFPLTEKWVHDGEIPLVLTGLD